MAAYRRVYESHHLQADCQEPGSAPEPYARQSSKLTSGNSLSLYFFMTRRGSRILQGRVSSPSEKGTPPIILTHVTGTEQFFGFRRNSWRQAVVRHLELYQIPSYSSCFVFTKHPVQLKTVTACFQNMFFSKRAPKQKGGCLDTLDTPLDPPLMIRVKRSCSLYRRRPRCCWSTRASWSCRSAPTCS